MALRGRLAASDLAELRDSGFSDGEARDIVASVLLNLYRSYFNLIADPHIDFPVLRAHIRRTDITERSPCRSPSKAAVMLIRLATLTDDMQRQRSGRGRVRLAAHRGSRAGGGDVAIPSARQRQQRLSRGTAGHRLGAAERPRDRL